MAIGGNPSASLAPPMGFWLLRPDGIPPPRGEYLLECSSTKTMGKNKNVYVIELDETVKAKPKFIEANVGHDPTLPCLYVGRTGLTPEERFQKHKTGPKASRLVRRFGLRLRPDLYEHLNPMTHEEAVKMEKAHAEALRSQGFPVWQK